MKVQAASGIISLLLAGQIDLMVGASANMLSPVFETKADVFAYFFTLIVLSAYIFLPFILAYYMYKNWEADRGLSDEFMAKFEDLFSDLRVHAEINPKRLSKLALA